MDGCELRHPFETRRNHACQYLQGRVLQVFYLQITGSGSEDMGTIQKQCGYVPTVDGCEVHFAPLWNND